LSTMTGMRPFGSSLRNLVKGCDISKQCGDGCYRWGWRRDEPFFLLLVGHDVDDGGGPFGAVGVFELLEQNLDGLAVGCVHGDQVDALGVL
jgi:hypothetical protein